MHLNEYAVILTIKECQDILQVSCGIILGLLGIALVAVAHPVYQYVTKKERKKIAPRILQLTEELSNCP